MKTILIPVDFSEHSTSTYKFAIRIAGATTATQLTFLHSYNDQLLIPDSGMNTGFDNGAYTNIQLIEEFKQLAENNMVQLKAKVISFLKENKLENISVNTIVTGGDPGWEITSVCNDINPDFIVMGTQGAGKKGILEGSMAKKIMNKARIPVIAVPMGIYNLDEFKIMYASNNSEKDADKIQRLQELFENIPTTIFAVHFLFKGSTDEEEQASKLKEVFSQDNFKEHVHFSLVDTNDKDDALEAFVDKNKINTIAFIAHKSNIFKWLFKSSISKHDFFKLGLPMVALKE